MKPLFSKTVWGAPGSIPCSPHLSVGLDWIMTGLWTELGLRRLCYLIYVAKTVKVSWALARHFRPWDNIPPVCMQQESAVNVNQHCKVQESCWYNYFGQGTFWQLVYIYATTECCGCGSGPRHLLKNIVGNGIAVASSSSWSVNGCTAHPHLSP